MCLSPKYITNRSLHYDLFKPLKLQVPCGKCEECKKVNRNEWFIRCVYEWKNHDYKNTYFYTLTYNNEHLPTLDGLPIFRKRDLQLFLKRLRARLASYDIKLKYLITCEFGELKGRSHYHALFYLDKEINQYWFFKFVQQSWIYGFVKPGQNVGFVNSTSGIQYVVKYVTKDYSHTDLALPYYAPKVFARYNALFRYIQKRWDVCFPCALSLNPDCSFTVVWFDKVSEFDYLEDLMKLFLKKMRRLMSDILPFHIQSTKLGSCLVDVPRCKDDTIPFIDSKSNIHYFQLPRYIKRLLWYDVLENEEDGKKTLFRLNEYGKKHIFDRLDDQISSDVIRYQTVLLNCDKFDAGLLSVLQKQNYKFKSWNDIVYWAQHFDLDLNVLAIYSRVFRGRVCPCEDSDEFLLDARTVKDSWKDYAWWCINSLSELDFGKVYQSRSLVTYFNAKMWNLHSYFQPYEYALNIIESMSDFIRAGQSAAALQLEKKVRKCRQYYNFIV